MTSRFSSWSAATRVGVLALCLSTVSLAAHADAASHAPPELSALTRLAQGAVLGVNVARPVPGFELAVLHQDRPIYHQAFGKWTLGQVADADSATKTMMGALMMSLTESNPATFGLDTRLSSILPAFDRPDKAAITLRQAFSH